MELRQKDSVAPKSGEDGGNQGKRWQMLAVQAAGLEEGGWDERRSRTSQRGGQEWGEPRVLT